MDDLLGDISWEKKTAFTNTVSDATVAISIKGSIKYEYLWKM